jgi:hypothetical protein
LLLKQKAKAYVALSLCSIKHYTIKAHGGEDVQIEISLTYELLAGE